jgi:hypothetical protein
MWSLRSPDWIHGMYICAGNPKKQSLWNPPFLRDLQDNIKRLLLFPDKSFVICQERSCSSMEDLIENNSKLGSKADSYIPDRQGLL